MRQEVYLKVKSQEQEEGEISRIQDQLTVLASDQSSLDASVQNLFHTISTSFDNHEVQKSVTKVLMTCIFLFLFFAYLVGAEDKYPSRPYSQVGASNTTIGVVVHLVPHSHDDVGWLKTVDQYFYGANRSIYPSGVQYVIDTVTAELALHPEYRFTIVEMAFLYRWWNQASDKERQRMKSLVAGGQIQFANGGWCASEEASIYYEDFIEQMRVGLRWLKETFDYVPSVAWHLDPFGHHASTASLFSRMGFTSLFISRIDYQDKLKRMEEQNLETIWQPHKYGDKLGPFIFTHIMYRHYSPPPGFYFDSLTHNQPIVDDPSSPLFNIQERANQLAEYFKGQSEKYRTLNLMHTVGEDFTYSNARMQFKNYDKLIKHINARKETYNITIRYSTPSEYIRSIRTEKKGYSTKRDDFFPYADYPHSMWTGFFTSRTAIKGFVKDFSRFAHSVKKHISELKISNYSETVRNYSQSLQSTIFGMEAALGVLQHHDAVSGTAKQHVTDDYIATGLRSIQAFGKLYRRVKAEEIGKQIGQTVLAEDLYLSLFWNESGSTTGLSRRLQAGEKVLVSLYNPGSKGTFPVRLRVASLDLQVVGHKNQPIRGDVVCGNPNNLSDCQLLLNLDMVESGNTYIKMWAEAGGSAKMVTGVVASSSVQFQFALDMVRLLPESLSFEVLLSGVETVEAFSIGYNYYQAEDMKSQNSGAYIFRPKDNQAEAYSRVKKVSYFNGNTTLVVLLEGELTQTRVYFSKILYYTRKFGCEIVTHLEPIPIKDQVGKEVTLNIRTKYKNNSTFYTDSMGLEAQERRLDYRPSWNYTVFEPVAGNYYPINSFISIVNEDGRMLTLLTDRSQGGTVLREGELELMVNRRLLMDDYRGVQEPLLETDKNGRGVDQTLRHYLVFGKLYRTVQKLKDQPLLPTFAPTPSSSFDLSKFKAKAVVFPCSSEVKMHLRPNPDNSYYLFLHNTNTVGSNTFKLPGEWRVEEQTLGGNQKLGEWNKKKLYWGEEGKKQDMGVYSSMPDIISRIMRGSDKLSGNLVGTGGIELGPFEMRTFIIRRPS